MKIDSAGNINYPNTKSLLISEGAATGFQGVNYGSGVSYLDSTLISKGFADAHYSTTGYTNEQAQDATGAMIDGSLTYIDANPLLQRSALIGDVTANAGSNSTTIATNAVTNAKLADVATQTFKGRTTAATGDPEDLTVAQAKTLLNLTGTNSGDQTSIVGITGTLAQFNTAVTDADLARTDAANTFTGVQTMTSPNITASITTPSSTFNLFNLTTTTGNLFGAATTLNVGGTPTTTLTHNYSTNATAAATTKTVNLGTGGVASSTTNINIGDADGGTTTISSPTTTVSGTISASNLTGTNTGNQTSIVGITGTLAQFNTAVTDADLARTDAANTFTGVQTFSTPIATGSVATMTATVGGGVPTPPNNTTTFLRGDGTFAIPSAGSGDMVLASTQTNSGAKTFLDGTFLLRNVANTFNGQFTNTNTAARTYTLKDASETIAFVSDITGTNSGTNTGDQTSIVGITGTLAQFNTAVTDADLARTDAANTFTGVQTFSTPIATGSVATMTATVGGGVPTPPNNTTTFLRGDGTFAIPSAGSGDMVLASTQTNSGAKTFLDGTFLLRNVANTFNGQFTNTNTAARTYTMPDRSGTVSLTDIDPVYIQLASNFSSTSTTQVAVTGWNFAVTAGKSYKIEINAMYQTAATTTGGDIGFFLTGGGVGTVGGKANGGISTNSSSSNLEAPISICTTTIEAAGSSLLTSAVTTINTPPHINADIIFNCTTSGTFNVGWGTEVAASAAQLNSTTSWLIYQLINP